MSLDGRTSVRYPRLMGFGNPQVPWIELEHQLSDRGHDGRPPGSPPWTNAGGDSPAWSRKRQPYKPPPSLERRADAVPYAELHCHSNFSFLDGASHPEELVGRGRPARARRARAHRPRRLLRRRALRRSGSRGRHAHGVRRRAHARARRSRRTASPTPRARTSLVLAQDPTATPGSARAISQRSWRGRRGRRAPRSRALADAGGCTGWCSPDAARARCRAALVDDGPAAAERELQRLIDAFGRDHVAVELWDHGDPLDSARNDALAELAVRDGDRPASPPTTCTTPRPSRRPLATALAAVRARRSPRRDRPLAPGGVGAHLRSGAEQARRFAALPRRRRSRGRARAARARSTSRSSRRTCRRSRVRRATTR